MAEHVLYIGESSTCSRNDVCFAAVGRNVIQMSVRYISSMVLFKSAISILIFCLDDLFIIENGVLKFPIITVLLLCFLFVLLVFVLYI